MTSVLPLVRFVEDDEIFRTSQELLLRTRGFSVEGYSSAKEFLTKGDLERPGCLVLDVRMPGMTGLELQAELIQKGCHLPIIFLSGHGDIAMAVHAMQEGAISFLEKPVTPQKLIETVTAAVESSLKQWEEKVVQSRNLEQFDTLTPREKQVVLRAALDTPNKVIARELDISEATVKMHRANAFAKLGAKSPLEAYRELERLGVISSSPHQNEPNSDLLNT